MLFIDYLSKAESLADKFFYHLAIASLVLFTALNALTS